VILILRMPRASDSLPPIPPPPPTLAGLLRPGKLPGGVIDGKGVADAAAAGDEFHASIILHPGHGEDLHPAGPGPAQDPGALLGRGSGGEQVIDEQHAFALNPGRVGDGKSPFDVVLTLFGVESHLGRGVAGADHRLPGHRRLGEGPGQEQGLVEAPVFNAFRVQGHGRQQIGGGDQLQTEGALQPVLHHREKGQLAGELEAGDGLGYGAVVEGRGPGPGEGGRVRLARPADAVGAVPGGKQHPAAGAQGAGHPLDLGFALRADRDRGRLPHRHPAEQAHPGQEEFQHRESEAFEPPITIKFCQQITLLD